jgi:hypothetical protein
MGGLAMKNDGLNVTGDNKSLGLDVFVFNCHQGIPNLCIQLSQKLAVDRLTKSQCTDSAG